MTEYIEFRPAFSPKSCYLLRDQAEVDYFAGAGGAPEAGLIEWARTLIKPNEIFIDVGAHVGTWAQDLAQHCERVYAFEPQMETWGRLIQGALSANLNVECFNAALGRHPAACVPLSIVSVDGGGSTLRHRAELGPVLRTTEVVQWTLDWFLTSEKCSHRVGLIKLDVEGSELDVLMGAVKTIAMHQPIILAEAWLHDWFVGGRQALWFYLESLRYKVGLAPGWPEMLLARPR